MPTLALLLALSVGGAPAHFFEGQWSCRVPHRGQLSLKVVRVEPTAPTSQRALKTQTLELFAKGSAARLLPATAAMLTADASKSFFSLSGTGDCAPPGPISDDDEPGSGAPRCARFEATADGWHGALLHWKLSGLKTSGARYALLLELARDGTQAMRLAVKDASGKSVGEARCHRVRSPDRRPQPKTGK